MIRGSEAFMVSTPVLVKSRPRVMPIGHLSFERPAYFFCPVSPAMNPSIFCQSSTSFTTGQIRAERR